MQTLYVNTTTSGTTPATVINSDGRAIVVRKIFVGAPASGATLTLFNENNALANNTTQIAFGLTYPTFSSTNPNSVPTVVDFRAVSGQGGSTEDDGIFCPAGGSISISSAMQVSVLWDYAQG